MSFLWKTMRFGVVGVLTAVVHYGLLYAGVAVLGLQATLASSLGFPVAVIFSYLMHYNWTFGEPAPHGRTLRRYLVMISCGFLINGGVVYTCDKILGWHYLLAQTMAFAVVVLWNFVLSNIWVFRR